MSLLLFLLAAGYVEAFTPVLRSNDAAAGVRLAAAIFTQPERVVPEVLPKIYVYDHCPFCVRVRLALGAKNVKHEVVFMGNDDVATPTAMVGKKIAPILEDPASGTVMAESLDICDFFDKDEKYGPTALIAPATGRTDIKAWQKGLQTTMRMLTRPRYMTTCLPEFMQKDGKDAFVKNHQLPPHEKSDWKGDGSKFSLDEKWDMYVAALDTTEEYIPALNKALAELEGMLYSEQHASEGGLSYDDIDLWARLRSLSLIKGAVFPPKVKAYMEYWEKVGDVPLYFNMAV
jgi:glutaredoxin 2